MTTGLAAMMVVMSCNGNQSQRPSAQRAVQGASEAMDAPIRAEATIAWFDWGTGPMSKRPLSDVEYDAFSYLMTEPFRRRSKSTKTPEKMPAAELRIDGGRWYIYETRMSDRTYQATTTFIGPEFIVGLPSPPGEKLDLSPLIAWYKKERAKQK